MKENKTLKEMLEAKRELEIKIRSLLCTFSNEYNIDEVNVTHVLKKDGTGNDECTYSTSVNIKL